MAKHKSYKLITDGKDMNGEAMPRLMTNFRLAVLGRKIVDVGYLIMDGEAFPCIALDNGDSIIIQRDDECNGPGVPVTALHGHILCQTHPKK
jgi:hypothetical protein